MYKIIGYPHFVKNLKEKFKLASDKTTKLIPTLFDKEKYVLHVRNLNLYKDLGMKLKLTKIHRVLQLDESPWLAKYINFNTEKKEISKGLRSKMYSFHKSFSKIEELTEDTIEDIKKCETLKENSINKITTSKFGSVLDDSIFEEIDRCKK